MSDNSVAESVVGFVVLAAAAAFLAHLAGGTDAIDSGERYEVTANFITAEGISPGSDVRIAGISVGSVSGMAFNPDTFEAEVTLSVERGVLLPGDSIVAISTEGLLGGNFVEILPGGSPDNVEPGGSLTQTQGALSLLSLLSEFVSAGQ